MDIACKNNLSPIRPARLVIPVPYAELCDENRAAVPTPHTVIVHGSIHF